MFTKKKKLLGGLAVLSLSAAMAMPTVVNASALLLENNGIYYSDYSSLAETMEAADDLNVQLSAEGDVLLKNDGMLPLTGNEKVSVFGAAQDSMVGAGSSVSVSAALKAEGFKINPALEKYYAGVGTTIGTETSNFSKSVENSLQLYSDAAVIILSRTGGEGNDLNTGVISGTQIEKQDNQDADGNTYDWKHENAATNADGEEVKHYLELTDSEEAMISYVKSHFKKIVVLLNTSNAMEMANLQNDEAINAILWIGRPGSTGIEAMAQILNGKVNPSGKLVDEWMRDFTTDPTWQNFGNNTQVGSENTYYYADGTASGSNLPGGTAGASGVHGIDYEEDIYLGYRYYETVYAEILSGSVKFNETTHKLESGAAEDKKTNAEAYWNYAVVYPFGYGLSYTDFEMTLNNVYYKASGKNESLPASSDGSIFGSSVNNPATAEKLYASVTVENTGKVAGKQVVEVYVTSPYNGTIEQAAVDLVGYAKTDTIRPGESQTVTVEFNVQDFAAFDYNDADKDNYKGYELQAGTYSIKVMEDSHNVADQYDFKITAEQQLKIDDFSHNEVQTWFSNGDAYDTLRINDSNHTQFNTATDGTADMVLLSRKDMVGTFPKAPTKADLTITDEVKTQIAAMDAFDADNLADESSYPWYKSDEELKTLMAGWTQASKHADDYSDSPIKLADMAGVDIKTEAGAAKWKEFMNQLTWDDITNLNNHGSHTTAAVAAIDKTASKDENGPCSFCGKTWCDEPIVASTWNVELAEQYGIINGNLGMFSNEQGWYGPGMNTHRSPFAGRNNEYYSQDGIQGGYIAAAVVKGAQSRGLNVYIKHMFINDQETHRNKECLFTWASERVIRNTYAKPFQMAMQEGGATSAMTAFARLGRVPASADYNFLTGLVREEWGWEGQYVTDAWAGLSCVTMDLAIRTGNDLPDGTASGTKAVSGTWDATATGVGTADKPSGNVIVGSGDKTQASLLQWYYARTCAERVLYVAANTQNNHNGVDTSAKTVTLKGTQASAMSNASVAKTEEELNGCEATYTIKSGSLPAGLSLNASTGAITGTPTEAGSYQVVVTCNAAGWISSEIKATITIDSAFKLTDEDDNVITSVTAKAGDEIYATLISDTVTTANYTKGVTYSVAEGALPAGVTLSKDGEIEGTAAEAGTYNITVKVAASKTSGRSTVTTNFYVDVAIVIEGEETQPIVTKDIVSVTEIENGYVITFSDASTITLKNGANGADGATATVAIDQDGYWVINGEKTNVLAQGPAGEKGETGAQGPAGEKGETGAQGPAGESGSGCGGVIGAGSALAAVAVLAGAAMIIRKKED